MTRSLYITGTDTGIGKTHAACVLLHALRAQGMHAVGMKPVASGCTRIDGHWRNEDALALQTAGDPHAEYADINPYALPLPLAPELAARNAGISIDMQRLIDAHARLRAPGNAVVVEGVGGWMAPLSPQIDQSELVRALQLPVVMVVGLKLGCINHARLTADAIRREGATLAGWIGNRIDPQMDAIDDNIAILQQRLPAPCLGVLPWQAVPDPASCAGHIRLDALRATFGRGGATGSW